MRKFGKCASVTTASAAGIASVFALTGCDDLVSNLHETLASTVQTGFKRGSDANIKITPEPNAKGETPAHSPITVSVNEGMLTEVIVTGAKGQQLVGSMNPESTVWTSNSTSLSYGTKYSIDAKAVDAGGEPTDATATLQTLQPKNVLSGQFAYVSDNASVGVGMPIRLEFSQPVKNTKTVEERLFVSSNKPTVGAWSWGWDKQSVTFRPKEFWPAKSKITVKAALRGVATSPGVYGEEDLEFRLTTGTSLIATVDANTQTMEVVKDGKLLRTIPVTTGKAGFETRSGIKPIMAKEGTVIMDAASGGTPRNSAEYYRLTVHHSMRLTPSGEYVHAAPWSVGSQGRRSSSHGCIGMSTPNATWLEQIAQVGDVVIVKNTGRDSEPGNGITEWNESWKEWLKDSKTGQVQVGPGNITSATA